jgi:GH15 family glucan-1,4-alpha-glucosidase
MDLVGMTHSASKFHDWATRAILKRADLVQRAVAKAHSGKPIDVEDQLHTRYTLEGEDGTRQEWPNYQLDGLGTWLWALHEHQRLTGQSIPGSWLQAAHLAGQYLETLWQTPCYDCWEEFPGDIHPYTLASIYGGLLALSHLDGKDRSTVLTAMQEFLVKNAVVDGYFVKKIGSNTVDASLLGLAVPYNMVDIDDPRFIRTLDRIELSLVKGGGVHRYPTDTYYGGGEWILLAGWLGWAYSQCGKTPRALELLHWIESQSDQDGNLPEQVPSTLNDPSHYDPWFRRWGSIANPLLWSHAKYLILKTNLNPIL